MQLTDFHYDLPEELIAHYPEDMRSHSRLCIFDPKTQTLKHQLFHQITEHLNAGDVLVLNDTKVIPARLIGRKETQGRIEILLERMLDNRRILAKARSSKALKSNQIILIDESPLFKFIEKQEDFYIFENISSLSLNEIFHQYGHMPLPPYIKRTAETLDHARYQTVFAKQEGAVAAPTAGLHFDGPVLKAIKTKGIKIVYLTLHVGAGTYEPVRSKEIIKHHMHQEWMQISQAACDIINQAKAAGQNIIAGGTTAARALETASLSGTIKPFSGHTDIFIYPGFQFKCIDMLITNFHLPGSTLLMLVAAFTGLTETMRIYHEAIKEEYRFYSYGDAMLLHKKTGAGQT